MFTILEGSTFCICDDIGDVGEKTSGLFAEDTRFLSRLKLTINGSDPLLLSSGKVEYFSAAFFLRNPLAGGLRQDQVLDDARALRRPGHAGRRDPRERVDGAASSSSSGSSSPPTSRTSSPSRTTTSRSATRCARRRCPTPVPARFDEEHNQFVLERSARRRSARRSSSRSAGSRRLGSRASHVEARPARALGACASTSSSSRTATRSCRRRSSAGSARSAAASATRSQRGSSACRSSAPSGTSSSTRSTSRSAISPRCACAARRTRDSACCPAAGMPWFMTVFGRDTIITCLQTLLFGPELARNALAALASLQAREDDPSIDAEPGKIVHEVRLRQGGRTLVRPLLRHDRRDAALPRSSSPRSGAGPTTPRSSQEFREPALRALEWIDRYGDLDGDGFIEARKRSERGLDVQSWKDSWRLAAVPRRPDRRAADRARRGAGLRLRREAPAWPRSRARSGATARSRSGSTARRTSSSGGSTRRSGARTAAASTRSRSTARRTRSTRSARTSATCSGRRSSLRSASRRSSTSSWARGSGPAGVSGRCRRTSRRTARSRTTTGRSGPTTTRSSRGGSRSTAAGPRRSGSSSAMLAASRHFDHQLPEVFAGLRRSETPFPIAYPTAARPQAWAAGTPVLLLQLLLGLRPEPAAAPARVGRAGRAAALGRLAPALGRARLRRDVGRARRETA